MSGSRKTPVRSRSPFWFMVLLFGLLSVACQIRIDLGPTNSSRPVSAALNAARTPAAVMEPTFTPTKMPTPDVPTATNTPTVEPTATQLPSPTATTTPTALPINSDVAAAGLTPAPTLNHTPVPPTLTLTPSPTQLSKPTPIPFIPARYPPERIQAPDIGLDAAVAVVGWDVVDQGGIQTSTWDIPVDAAGWHQNSAAPGQGSNVVLSGHHNIGSEVFRNIVELELGDELILQADGRAYRYQVTDRFILLERGASTEQRHQNAQWIMPTVDERVTLVTCWPYNDNSHRLIVVAKPRSGNS